MFKRRKPRSTAAAMARWVYPRGGYVRALRYMAYRLRRLPDPAYKISRGIAAGVFVCFTPLFGLHFLVAAGLAWLMGGNILAALLATFFGNPLTFPIIAGLSVELGSWMMGLSNGLPLHETFSAFSRVSVELWLNLKGAILGGPVQWDGMSAFFRFIFLPYLVGGMIPGVIAGLLAYGVSRPIIAAYQKSRIKRLTKKFEKQRRVAARTAARRLKEEARNG